MAEGRYPEFIADQGNTCYDVRLLKIITRPGKVVELMDTFPNEALGVTVSIYRVEVPGFHSVYVWWFEK